MQGVPPMAGAASNQDMQQMLPPFNGRGEQNLPQAGGAPMPQQPPVGALGGAPSAQDLQALQQLMQQQQGQQRQGPGAFSLPPSPGAGRFNI